jgi:hypothetical protein
MQERSIRFPASCLAILGLTTVVPCLGQSQADPTRPAAAWLAAQPRASGAEAVAEPVTPGVHIVVTGPTRTFAMVDGKAVRPGEIHNGSRLVAIDRNGVTWSRGGIQEKSSMSPGVEKTAPSKQAALQQGPKARKNPVNGEHQ